MRQGCAKEEGEADDDEGGVMGGVGTMSSKGAAVAVVDEREIWNAISSAVPR